MFSSLSQQATVTTSPVQVFSVSGLAPGAAGVVIANAGPAVIYVSGTSSASAAGFPVPASAQLVLTGAAANLWAVTASGTAGVTGSLGTDVIITALQDSLMVTVPVTSAACQVFDLYQYQGAAQAEYPLAVLGSAASPAVLAWPPSGPVAAGGQLVNPAGMLGWAVAVCTGASAVYLGASGSVTSTTGLPVPAGTRALLAAAAPPAALFAACAAGTSSSVVTGLASLAAVA